MNNKLKAFTLGEVLVTLLIVGVIAAMLIPTLKNIQPDRQKLMFKKAYTTVERIVTELVNDDYLYSETDDAVGLDNTNDVEVNGAHYSGSTKFCKLFAMKVNVVDDGGQGGLQLMGDIGSKLPPQMFPIHLFRHINENQDGAFHGFLFPDRIGNELTALLPKFQHRLCVLSPQSRLHRLAERLAAV